MQELLKRGQPALQGVLGAVLTLGLAAAAELSPDPVAEAAWRSYRDVGGLADLERFARVWAATKGLKAGSLERLSITDIADTPTPKVGKAWPPRFDLNCVVITTTRRSGTLGPPTSLVVPNEVLAPPDTVETSSPHEINLHVDLILRRYCGDGCRGRTWLASIDDDSLKGRTRDSNPEGIEDTTVDWARSTGRWSYNWRSLPTMRSAHEISSREDGVCRMAPPTTSIPAW